MNLYEQWMYHFGRGKVKLIPFDWIKDDPTKPWGIGETLTKREFYEKLNSNVVFAKKYGKLYN